VQEHGPVSQVGQANRPPSHRGKLEIRGQRARSNASPDQEPPNLLNEVTASEVLVVVLLRGQVQAQAAASCLNPDGRPRSLRAEARPGE
jgi:hypothetical protein